MSIAARVDGTQRYSTRHRLPMSLVSLLAVILPLAWFPGGGPQNHALPPESAIAGSLQQDRVYSLVRLNGRPVPAEVEFASTDGSRHWVRMEEAILRLRRDGTFTASARFYRQLLQKGTRPPQAAARRLLNDGASGRYTVRGDTIVLNVAKRKDTAAGTAYGRIVGDRLRIRHTLRDGQFRHPVDVELRIDPSIW